MSCLDGCRGDRRIKGVLKDEERWKYEARWCWKLRRLHLAVRSITLIITKFILISECLMSFYILCVVSTCPAIGNVSISRVNIGMITAWNLNCLFRPLSLQEKMKGKNKLVPRLLGINKESVVRVDERTKEVRLFLSFVIEVICCLIICIHRNKSHLCRFVFTLCHKLSVSRLANNELIVNSNAQNGDLLCDLAPAVLVRPLYQLISV